MNKIITGIMIGLLTASGLFLSAGSVGAVAGSSDLLVGKLLPSGTNYSPITGKMWIAARSGDLTAAPTIAYQGTPAYTVYYANVGNFSSWAPGDVVVALIEKSDGRYSVANLTLSGSVSTQNFPDATFQTIPAPSAAGAPGAVNVSWTAAVDSGSGNIAGYNVYRDTSATGSFSTKANTSVVSGTSFSDTVAAGTYYYKIKLVFRGSPNQIESTYLSAASAGASPQAATGGSLAVATTSLPNGTVGTAYSQTLSASGGTAPYTWALSSGSLPPGLALSSAGVISGTPAAAGGPTNFTVQAADSASHTATAPLAITIVTAGSSGTAVIAVSPAASPAGTKFRVTLVSGRGFGATQGNSLLSFVNKTSLATFSSITTTQWSDSTIEAIVPSLASGLYDVKVLYVQTSGGILQQFESNPAGFQITGSFGFGTAVIYPCPFNAGVETVTIAVPNSTGAANIGFYVFDRTARLVFKQVLGGANQTVWDGHDLSGNIVGDGAYLVRVVNEDSKALLAKGKLLVIKH